MERSKHLFFEEDYGFGNCHKTRRFVVKSVFDGVVLGELKWLARWRQYVFFPEGDCVWSLDCLEDLTTFIHDLTRQKRLTLMGGKNDGE